MRSSCLSTAATTLRWTYNVYLGLESVRLVVQPQRLSKCFECALPREMKPVRKGLLLTGAAMGMICTEIFAQKPPLSTVQPGVLETFITHTKNVRTQKDLLGSLTGPGIAEATLEAIVAWEPQSPAVKVKGLEVRLKTGRAEGKGVSRRRPRDEEFHRDSLKEFQDDLSRLAAEKDQAPGRRAGAEEGMISTAVCNRVCPEQSAPRDSVLEAGWYKKGNQLGVLLATQGDWYFFPDGDLARFGAWSQAT